MLWNKKPAEKEIDEISGRSFGQGLSLRLLPYLKGSGLLFSFCLFLVVLSTAIALYTPLLLGRIVDEALLPKDKALLIKFTLLYVGLEALRLIALFSQSYYLQRVGQTVMQKIRSDLFGRLTRMPVSFFDRNPVGRLVTRVTNDTANLSEIFSAGFVTLLSDILIILGVVGAVIALHPRLGLIAVSVFPVMLALMVFFAGWLRTAFRRARETLSRLNGYFAELMSAMPVVQMMGREDLERANFARISSLYREHQFAGVRLYALFHPAITILSALSMAFVIYFGALYVQEGRIALGTLVAFLAYIQILYQPVRNITDKFNIFLAAMSSEERIFNLLDLPEEEGLREPVNLSAEGKGVLRGALDFADVSFSYNENAPTPAWALRDVSFRIRPGERIAVVGHTGAGKSTLLSLLFRFYDLKHGRILLDGRDLREYPKQELRERIGFVQQDVFLFAGTIRENLLLLRRGISDAEILAATAATGMDYFLSRLPDGLNTVLDERGANLSQGERQLLAFTRVYLQKPEILVLDEATASVDAETETRMQLAAEKLMHGRTSVVIAHRLSTIRGADRIFVFEGGALMETGSHAELAAADGLYRKFLDRQESSSAATGAHSTSSM